MATPTKKEKLDKRRAAGEIFADIAKAVEAGKVPQFAELLTKIADRVGLDNIADAFAEAMKKDGNPKDRKKFALDYANLLKQFQQMTGEITVDEVSRLPQMQLDALIDERLEKLNARRNATAGPDSGGATKANPDRDQNEAQDPASYQG